MADTLIFKVVDIDLHGKRPAHIFLIDDLFRRTVFTGAVTVEYQRLVGYFQCVLGIMERFLMVSRIMSWFLKSRLDSGSSSTSIQGSMVSALAISTI